MSVSARAIQKLGARINDAMASAEEAYWKEFLRQFPELKGADPMGASQGFYEEQVQAVFDILEDMHPDPKLVHALREIYNK